MQDARLAFDPLCVIEFAQFQLWRREDRVIQRRLTDLAPALLALIVRPAIPREEGLTICDPPLPCIAPDRDPLPCQPLRSIDVEALDTEKPLGLHGPQELHPAQEVSEPLRGDSTPAHPASDVSRRPSGIGAVLMRPGPRGMKGCNERRV